MKKHLLISFCLFSLLMYSCISEAEKQAQEKRKIAFELEQKVREEQKLKEEARQKAIQDSLNIIRIEKERQEKELYEKYINNRLSTGATPYAYLYGYNKKCSEWGCSKIKVKTPNNSEVLVLIKKNDHVVKHAYIRASSSYTFEMQNGTYQTFFYYGKGWNPSKVMKETNKGTLRGGFISNEHFGKDEPQYLSNNILEYELILQQNGNFQTRPSSKEEAF